jgi:plasmid stabilization system protein ParE
MALRVKISARAGSQIRRAAQWWLENRPAAPGAIAEDISESLALLAEQPGIGTKYEGARAGIGTRGAGSSRSCWQVRPNKSFDTDAQVRPCALRTRFVCAGQVRRYPS